MPKVRPFLAFFFALAFAGVPVFAADQPSDKSSTVQNKIAQPNSVPASVPANDPPVISCGGGVPGGINCAPSKRDLKEAGKAYASGLKLEQSQNFEAAFRAFDEAARMAPLDSQYFSAREVAKSQIVYQHTERGDALLANAQRLRAAAEYRAALRLDPDNNYMQSRLADALRDVAPRTNGLPELLPESQEIKLQPSNAVATFHYTGDVRTLFTQMASAYGMMVQFDDSVQNKQVRFYVDDVDFFTALSLACRVGKSMWAVLGSHQFLIAAENQENHKQYDRMSLATFSVPNASAPQDVTELVTSLKNICEFQKISPGLTGTVEVRAPQAMLSACMKLLHQLNFERPQVALDIRIYQIDHNFTRDIGLHIPDTFNLYNIPVAALAALGGQSISSLVNQLVSSGGVNQAGSSALSGILAQLQGQSNGIFSQPLATFGGGLTFSGLSLDHFTAALSLNESWSRSLSNVTLRAGQGKEATMHIGERYPILNASYAPIYNSPQISQVLGNQTYVAPFPSVSYEDLGLEIKTTTAIHGDDDVSMKLALQLRSLTGSSANGVPLIANQQYEGSIRLRDGEPAVIAGEITTNDQYAIAGIPGLAAIPGLSQGLVDNNKMKEYDELLIVLTPHILSNQNRKADEIWISER
jgi:general secretion pathway protein D